MVQATESTKKLGAVDRPGQAVGQTDVIQHHRGIQAGIVAIELAGALTVPFIHQAGDKTPLGVASTIVETIGREGDGQFGVMDNPQAGAVEDSNPGILGKNQIALLGQRQRTDPRR